SRRRERPAPSGDPLRAVRRLPAGQAAHRGARGRAEGSLSARGGASDEDRAAGSALLRSRAADLRAHLRARHAHPAPGRAREAARPPPQQSPPLTRAGSLVFSEHRALGRLVLERALESLSPLLASLSCLTLPLHRRLLIVLAPLHLLKEAVLQHLLLELLQGSLDLVVEDDDLHSGHPEVPRRAVM